MKKLKEFFTFQNLLLLLMLFFIITTVSNCNILIIKSDNQQLSNAIIDSIKLFQAKNDLNHTKKKIVVTNHVDVSLEIKSKDVKIQKLQKLISQYKSELKKSSNITTFSSMLIIDTIYTKPLNEQVSYHWRDSIQNKCIDWDYNVFRDTIKNVNRINFSLVLHNK